MKKLISLIICTALLIISLVGCGGESEIQAPTDELNLEFYYDMPGSFSVETHIKTTIETYKIKYPDVKVNVEFKKLEMSDDAGEAATKKYATEIMAGKCADVIFLDDTFLTVNDTYKIQQSGSLVDLKPYIENDSDFKTDELQLNVVNATKVGERQYIIPTHYMMGLFISGEKAFAKTGFDMSLFDSTDTLIYGLEKYYKSKDKDNSQRFFPSMVALSYFPFYMDINLVEREKQAVNIDERFKKGLDFFKLAYDFEDGLSNPMYDQSNQAGSYDFFFEEKENMPYATDFYSYAASLNDLITKLRCISVSQNPIIQPWRSQAGEINAAVSKGMAISNASENKQNAWNFIKLCISDASLYQLESCRYGTKGFPVNRESLKQFTKEWSEAPLGAGEHLSIPTLATEQQAMIFKMQDEVAGAVYRTSTDREISILVRRYGKDEITKEECLKQIEDYLEIYISE